MSSIENLNYYKKTCNEILQYLQQIKKVDKDIIDQMNYKVSELGCDINNNILENQNLIENQGLIHEVLQLYENTTQNLDKLIYKHKSIREYVQNQSRSQIREIDETAREPIEKKDISEFSFFNHLQRLNFLEDNRIEFKNFSYQTFNQKKQYLYQCLISYRSIIKKAIVSFLNRQGGCIYVGIRDDSTQVSLFLGKKIVVGMQLSHSEMDDLKRKIIEIKDGISPQMNDKVKVDFLPIKQGNRWYKGHWIMRIKIKQGDLKELYQFDNQNDPYTLESYFREDGAVKRYKINDFIREKVSILTSSNIQRSVIKISYQPPDHIGVQACMSKNSNSQQSHQVNQKMHNNLNQYDNIYAPKQYKEQNYNKDQYSNQVQQEIQIQGKDSSQKRLSNQFQYDNSNQQRYQENNQIEQEELKVENQEYNQKEGLQRQQKRENRKNEFQNLDPFNNIEIEDSQKYELDNHYDNFYLLNAKDQNYTQLKGNEKEEYQNSQNQFICQEKKHSANTEQKNQKVQMNYINDYTQFVNQQNSQVIYKNEQQNKIPLPAHFDINPYQQIPQPNNIDDNSSKNKLKQNNMSNNNQQQKQQQQQHLSEQKPQQQYQQQPSLQFQQQQIQQLQHQSLPQQVMQQPPQQVEKPQQQIQNSKENKKKRFGAIFLKQLYGSQNN